MNDEQKTAYVIGMAVGGLIEALGMMSDNIEKHNEGKTMPYDGKAFYKLMDERGLHHNAIMMLFRH